MGYDWLFYLCRCISDGTLRLWELLLTNSDNGNVATMLNNMPTINGKRLRA